MSRSAQHFSLSEADFERESVLKRRRQHSPPRESGIGFRTRSKSKSRAHESTLRRLPSVQGHEFIALGRSDRPRAAAAAVEPPPRSSAREDDRGRKRDRSVRTRSHGVDGRAQAKAKAKPRDDSDEGDDHERKRERARSKSKSRKRTSSRRRSSSRSRSRDSSRDHVSSRASSKRQRSKSKSVARPSKKSNGRAAVTASSSSSSPSPSPSPSPPPPPSSKRVSSSTSARGADQELQRDIERDERKLKQAKSELASLESEMAALQKRLDAKKYEVMDLQIVVDGLQKRRELQKEFLRRDSFTAMPSSSSVRREPSPETQLTTRKTRTSKRPCIVDEEEDVEIIDQPPVVVKKETRREGKSSSSRHRGAESAAASAASTTTAPTTSTTTAAAKPAAVDQMSDYFWGRVDIAKLLVQPRIRNIPDGSSRKGRHLAFNPIQQDVFAIGSDDGGLVLWNYARQNQLVSKVVSFDPLSFRKENQCAESMAWSPDGERLAIAFRDPIAGMGEFCVVRLHQLKLVDGPAPQVLPRDRVKAKSTTLHPRGISAIDWVPGGYGARQGARGVLTAGSDHAVMLWEEHEGQTDFKWRVLHREHRSDVRSICVHSQGNTVYTGGLDGLVVRYDMHAQRAHTTMERRRPAISKINAVLENPHNPNLLLISSVEQSEHNLLLHDLRERYDDKRQATMTLSWLRASDSKSMSQYIVPRWSPGGFHVSCGSTSGLVNIWDVRVRGPTFPLVLPQQSITVHQKQVLHATWHPRYDAMFSISHDRTIGLLTFR